LAFYEPSKFRTQHKSNRQASNVEELVNPKIDTFDPACSHPVPVFASDLIVGHHKASLALFDDLLADGVCREQARGVLPQNLYTEYYGSVNLNNLLKFVELRIHEGAQYEIQKVAMACLEIAEHIWPITIGSYREIRGL
jgi:thymidylate synthase (FAD)